MISRLALWLALRVIGVVGILVPRAARGEWTREWDAELRHQSAQIQRRRSVTWRTNMELLRRALGSLPDAAWIRRQFTLDADALHDAVHGARMLLKAPGFTAISLLVFAIGIGATTAMVSVTDVLFVRRLPVRQPERVMTLWQYNRETGAMQEDVAPANAIDWLKRVQSFETIAVAEPWTVQAVLPGREPSALDAVRVGEQFFAVLGTPMLHGRPFLPQEYRRGGERVAIFSYAMWRDSFGSDVSLIGRRVRLNDTDAFTLVGVLPPDFELRLFDNRTRRPEPSVWLPKPGFEEFEPNLRGTGFWNVLGRLRLGVSVDQARAELDTVSAQLTREYPQTNKNVAAQIVPLRTHLVGSLRSVLPVLLGAAALLLMVACANVANLLLARGVGRAREFAVRQALGAGRARLVRQMLVETVLLATLGGALGLVLARWTLNVIARLRPLDVARVDQIPIDARAAAIACGVTLVAAVIAGLTPAMQLSRPQAASVLREGRISARRGLRRALVVGEVAAALVLVVSAGLLVRSFVRVQRVDPGFSRDQVAALQVFTSPRLNTPPKRVVFFDQVLERMRSLPGVVAAGGVSSMPFGAARVMIRVPLAIDARPAVAGERSLIYATAVAGDYWRAMGVPLLEGRLFDATDTASSRQVVLVSRNAAQQFWPGADPLGSKVRFQFAGTSYDADVVGVVGEVRHEALDGPPAPELYVPYPQSGFYGLTLVVRMAPAAPTRLQVLKEQIWAIDPRQSIFSTAMLDDWVSQSLLSRRFSLFLIGGFAVATLLLATAGVYGVVSFVTSQRTREFGVRMALGADRRDIGRLVLREGLQLAGVGVLIGVAAALPLTRSLRSMLFGVTTFDPMTFASVSLALVLVAVAACYIPARRALKVDPAEALRID